MIEKYYTWVDVQFFIFSQFPSLFNVSRDFILSFVSYKLIRGNMFYGILNYGSLYVTLCFELCPIDFGVLTIYFCMLSFLVCVQCCTF